LGETGIHRRVDSGRTQSRRDGPESAPKLSFNSEYASSPEVGISLAEVPQLNSLMSSRAMWPLTAEVHKSARPTDHRISRIATLATQGQWSLSEAAIKKHASGQVSALTRWPDSVPLKDWCGAVIADALDGRGDGRHLTADC
jgi:hypothetical protein